MSSRGSQGLTLVADDQEQLDAIHHVLLLSIPVTRAERNIVMAALDHRERLTIATQYGIIFLNLIILIKAL